MQERLLAYVYPHGGYSSQVEHHVRDKFATPILYGKVKFKFYDTFST